MKKGIGIVLLCVVAMDAYCQTPPTEVKPPPADLQKVIPATPNATKLTEFYAQKPNMYTGTANVSIPLYSINFDGWQLPLSLSYNATGIRATEEASEVGLGWALSATGVISRTVNGGDDFFEGGLQGGRGYVIANRKLTHDLGYTQSDPNVPLPPYYYTSYYRYLITDRPDTQPDIFNYNFFGYSGSFVLTQDLVSPKVVKITQDPCLIEFNLATKVFIVTTPQGFKGTFDVRERTTTASSGSSLLDASHRLDCCLEGYIDFTYLRNSSGTFRTITSWYLSKITSPRGKQINFTYELNNDRSPNVSVSQSFPEAKEFEGANRVCTQTIQEHVYLQTIESDEIQVNFQMEDREDIRKNNLFISIGELDDWEFPVPRKLKRYKSLSIQGLISPTFTKTVLLRQSYFNQNYQRCDEDNEDELNYLRSRLDRVEFDDGQVYSFFYVLPNKLPNKLTTGIDHFGFYNGSIGNADLALYPPHVTGISNSLNVADTATIETYRTRSGREVNFDVGTAGVLSKVVYPTGGHTLFTYEGHTYESEEVYFKQSDRGFGGFPAGGTRIQKIEEFDYNSLTPARTKKYYYVESIGPNSVSTGRLMVPLYNRYARLYTRYGKTVPYYFEFLRKTFGGIPGSHAAQGKIIGYGKVIEEVIGAVDANGNTTDKYQNTYYFENNPSSVFKFNSVAVGTPNLNGQLKESQHTNNNGQLVQTVVNDNYNHVMNSKVKGLMYEVQSQSSAGSTSSDFYLTFSTPYKLDRTFITPYVVTTTTASAPGAIDATSSKVEVTYTYNDSTRLIKTQAITNSLTETIMTEYKRAFDYAPNWPLINLMRSNAVHMTEPVIEEIVTKGYSVIGAKANHYKASASNTFVNLDTTYLWNADLGPFSSPYDGVTFRKPYEWKVAYEYDDVGKIQQYTSADGVTNSFIWGYNNTLPIVHGINITYGALKAAYDASPSGSGFQNAIRNHTNTIGKQITTYEHFPLVGIKSVTNPNKLTTTYKYDSHERLESIVDNDGHTVEQYEYNYRKPAPVFDASVSKTVLDFGVLTPGPHEDILVLGERLPSCSTNDIQSFRLTNTGTEYIEIQMVVASVSYKVDPPCTLLSPGNSVELNASFDPTGLQVNQTYNSQVDFAIKNPADHSTIKTLSVQLKAIYETKRCPSVSDITANFGVKIGGGAPKIIQVNFPNDGNEGFYLWRAVPYLKNSDGSIGPEPTGGEWDYTLNDGVFPTSCIMPGVANQTIDIAFHPQSPHVSPLEGFMVFGHTNTDCPIIKVALSGQRIDNEDYRRHIALNPSPLPLIELSKESFVTRTITVKNDGADPVWVTNITSNHDEYPISVSPKVFNIIPGATQDITVTFNPGMCDRTYYESIFTFVVNDGLPGVPKNFVVKGQRQTIRSLKFLEGNNVVAVAAKDFTQLYTNAAFTIVNDGTATVSFAGDGVSYSFPNPNGGGGAPEETSQFWLGTIADLSDFPCGAPARTMNIMMKDESQTETPKRQYVNLAYTKEGHNVATYANVAPVNGALTRTLVYPSNDLELKGESLTLASSVTITNSGNSTMHFDGTTQFSDWSGHGKASRFTVLSGLPQLLLPAHSATINIQYKVPAGEDDFGRYGVEFSVGSDATGYHPNLVSVTIWGEAQDKTLLTEVKPTSGNPGFNNNWDLTYRTGGKQGSIRNDGTRSILINSISITGTNAGSFTLQTTPSITLINCGNAPYRLLPGQSIFITIGSASSSYPSSTISATLNVTYNCSNVLNSGITVRILNAEP